MESPGTCIKRERELRGFSLQDVHKATRIPEKNLRALEADDFDALPQHAFVKGYIRACCKYMGLDETDLVLRYELFIKDNTPVEESPPPEEDKGPAARSFSLSSKQIVAALVVIGIIIIVLFYMLSGSPRHEELVKAAPESVPASPAKSPAPAALTETAKPAAPAHESSSAAEVSPPGHVLKIIATDDVWVKLNIDNKKPFEVLFKKGNTRQWLMKKGVSLVIGNAGGASIVFDGEPVKMVNMPGRVVRMRLPSE
ncbi:MAG: RodZ domain-containing protein [Thermodesulfobacteriota bacterium]